MITFLNRKEVCNTHALKKHADIRYLLQAARADSRTRTISRTDTVDVRAGTRAYTGTIGRDQMQDYEYHIYVHKDDYEEAMYLIREKA